MDYTNLYNFLTSSGIIVPNDASVLEGIQTKFQEIFGTDIDLSAETSVGRLIETIAVVVKTTLGVTAQSATQFNVNEATGVYLDAIAQIYDLKRIAATKTKITIKCYFSDNPSGTDTITAGSYIMCSANGALFRTDSDIPNERIQDEEGRYYGVGTATAVETGPISVPEGTVNSIQTAVLGWIGVTNISPTYIGTNMETDEAFRKRILASRPIGIGFDTHLESALNRIEGVYSNCVLENNTGAKMVKNGVSIDPHSIFVCTDFIETEDIKAQIATAIAQAKPVGTGIVKDASDGMDGVTLIEREVKYGYGNGYSQDIYFWKAKRTPIIVNLTYSYGNYTGTNIEGDIRTVVSSYMDTIGVGGTIYCSMITNWLINRLDIGVGSVLIQKSGSEKPYDTTIDMMGYETPYAISDTIFVKALG